MMQLSSRSALSFLEAMHLFHHVSELVDVELGDRSHFADFSLSLFP